MPVRAVALLSGGLDSILAIRILQDQGIEVEAVNFRTTFTCCQETASQAAQRLGVRLTVIGQDEQYLDIIRRPKYGYGRGANPCVDCRIYMFQKARLIMDQVGASLVVSGEVLGQRPNSQKRRDLDIIAAKSRLERRLLRPLSAKLLRPTIPETTGEVDRERLFEFVGRSRKGLHALARHYGFADDEIPAPSTGCMLTERTFSSRVFDLIRLDSDNTAWDFEILKVGRHLRFDSQTKMVVGRRESENELLEYLHAQPDARSAAVLRPENFNGPLVMVIGEAGSAALDFAGGLLLRYGKAPGQGSPQAWLEMRDQRVLRKIAPREAAAAAETL